MEPVLRMVHMQRHSYCMLAYKVCGALCSRVIENCIKTLNNTVVMGKSGPIILIDDDAEDEELFREALHKLGIPNKLVHFEVCSKAWDYLKNTPEIPFLIISDVNLPIQSGIEFKRQIDEDPQLRSKSIPFVFLSTSIDERTVNIAYKEMTVQGFFKKPNSFEELTSVIKLLMDYWELCRHPNSQ